MRFIQIKSWGQLFVQEPDVKSLANAVQNIYIHVVHFFNTKFRCSYQKAHKKLTYKLSLLQDTFSLNVMNKNTSTMSNLNTELIVQIHIQ